MNQTASFAAIDFETATRRRSSACALGVVIVDASRIVEEQRWFIRPPGNEYEAFNTRIHGISAADTADAPPFDHVWSEAAALIGSRLVVAHNTAFDMSVLRQSAAHHGYVPPEASFACTYRLAHSLWPDRFSWKLPNMCEALGIDGLNHHDPLSDARAAARVLLAMCEHNACDVVGLSEGLGYKMGLLSAQGYAPYSNAAQRITSSAKVRVSDIEPTIDSIDPDGALFGRRVAFTGKLESLTREAAFQVTVNSGGAPSTSVSKQTDYLVVGMTDYAKVGTDGMSSKLRKAVELSGSVAKTEIIDENDFLRLADPAAFS